MSYNAIASSKQLYQIAQELVQSISGYSQQHKFYTSQDNSHGRYIGDINVTSRLDLISKYLVKSREFHNSLRKH